MNVLDPEYQRLIKIRYILRTEDVLNKDDLEEKMKHLQLNSKTLGYIADDISDFKQEGNISRPSIGRWFGEYKSMSGINRSNLDSIAKYLLCENWNVLVSLNLDEIEQRIYKEHRLELAERLVSMDSKADDNSFGLQKIVSHNIPAGEIVEVRYGKKNKRLRIKKLSSPDRYIVLASDSAILKQGWSLSIPAILLGVNVIGLDIKDRNDIIKTVYKSSGTVNNIIIL